MTQVQSPADPQNILGRLLSPAGKLNPYPLYEEMRVHGPVVSLGGMVVVCGHAECARALREPLLLSTDGAVQDKKLPGWQSHSSWRWLTKNMLFSNEPNHDRYRRFFGNAFSARSVDGMQAMVERLADDTVRHVAELGKDGQTVDMVPEFSYRFATAIIGELLGIPEEDQPGLRGIIGDITTALEPIRDPKELERGDAGMDRLAEYFHKLVADRHAIPGADLTTIFIKARNAEETLSEEELIANLMLLLVAASEAPQDLLSSTVRMVLDHPTWAHRLREYPQIAPGFVDETLRLEPAVQVLSRVASAAVDFCGITIPEGASVTLLIAAGNRDPRRFSDPEVFDPERPDNQPLTFSIGPHYCLGAALARLSAETVLPRLLRRLPNLAASGPATFRTQLVQRGNDHIPVRTC